MAVIKSWLSKLTVQHNRQINIKKVDIDELYDFSLRHTEELRPWAFDENGIYVGLEARCGFVKLYLDRKGRIDKEDIAKTEYFNLLKKGFKDKPRDGGRDWIYENPEKQVMRFIQLINSFCERGYIIDRHSEILNNFCSSFLPHAELDIRGKVNIVSYKDRPFAGLISVVEHKGFFSVWNGNHRLAILKVVYERSLLAANKKDIPVILHR